MANTKLPARLLDTSAIPALNVTGDLTVDTTTLKVDSTNNRVGIGEASPLGKLHIKGSDTGATASAQGNSLILEDTENGLSILSSTAGAGYINFGDSDDNDVGMIIYGHSSNSMSFWTNAAKRATIDASGDVLVGSTTNLNVLSGTPKLQIGSGTGHSSIQWYSGTDSVAGLYFGDASTGTGRYPGYIEYRHNNDSMAFRVNGDTRLLIESTGNVGIGTTDPNAPLTVWTASSATSQSALRLNNPGGFTNAGAGAELIFSQDRSTSEDYRMAAVTSSQQYAGSSSGADLKFWTRLSSSITNKMTLAANGTLIIKPSGVTTGLQLEGRSSDNNFFIQFNTHGGGANKASIGTDTGNNTLQYGADNHKFVNQATNATAMSFPATAIPRVHVGSGEQYGATGKRGIRVGRTIYNWFNYGKNEGHTYLHIKTDLANNNSNTQPTMSTVHIKGYTYGAETIDSILGFHNWSSSFHQKVYTNNGSRTVVSSSYAPYLSSDGYCVIVLSIGNNYPGISIDWHQAFDPYTFRDIDVLAYSKSASTSGVY